MNELKWIEDLIIPETSTDAIELLKIIDEFDKFPNNLYHARAKRFDLLEDYMFRIVDLDITNVIVADIANEWLSRLEYLIKFGGTYGRDKWYKKNVTKLIKKMKKTKLEYPEKILNSENMWFSYTAEEIMEPWKEMMN
jgi:hypothetical protein